MNVVTLFVPHPQASLIEEPSKGSFNHVAVLSEPAAVFRVALGDQGFHSTLTQGLTNLLLGVVGSIRQHFLRTLPRPTTPLLDTWNPIHQGNGHLRIMDIGPRVFHSQGSPLPIDNQMAF
jgi:hypothetical protein